MKKVAVIGGGFSGLSAACYMAKEGYEVELFEKNSSLGGRARQLEINGFRFDMGPTFYWMPDVFESFFEDFGSTVDENYRLVRLDPGYEIYFGKGGRINIHKSLDQLIETFEGIEKDSSLFLRKYLRSGAYNYSVAMDKVVYKPGNSMSELIMPETIRSAGQFTNTLSAVIRKNIRDSRLRQVLEFSVLFLGAKADRTPSFYRFMNYADMILGTWHVMGGMFKVVEAMSAIAQRSGVRIHTGTEVRRIIVNGKKISAVETAGGITATDIVISTADYRHAEMLLPYSFRSYSDKYWRKKDMAPSAILFYLAFDKRLKNVNHHTLFFDSDFERHADMIYGKPGYPDDPLFYASFPSVTDRSLVPEEKDLGIILIPLASGIKENRDIADEYYRKITDRIKEAAGQNITDNILFKRTYYPTDFIRDYNAYMGNAYGLANTLFQTAFLKPKVKSRKLENLFYAGQLTVPGPGVPSAIISGKIASGEALKYLRKKR